MKMGSHDVKALKDAEECIKIDESWAKGHFRKGSALMSLDRKDEAKEAFLRALELDPENGEVRKILRVKFNYKRKEVVKTEPAAAAAAAAEPVKAAPVAATETPTPSINAPLNSMEAYQSAVSNLSTSLELPYDKTVVDGYVKEVLESVQTTLRQGNKVSPAASFLAGFADPKTKERPPLVVAIEHAFDSPETLSSCQQFLRQYATDMKAQAACIVVNKSDIAFPQTWREGGSEWTMGNSSGVFVQVQAQKKKLYFVKVHNENRGKRAQVDEPVEISTKFSVMEHLLKA